MVIPCGEDTLARAAPPRAKRRYRDGGEAFGKPPLKAAVVGVGFADDEPCPALPKALHAFDRALEARFRAADEVGAHGVADDAQKRRIPEGARRQRALRIQPARKAVPGRVEAAAGEAR